MDVTRIVSGLLGFPLVLIVLFLGNNIIIDIALAIIAFLAMNEYFNAVSKISKPVKWVGYVSSLSIAFTSLISNEYMGMYITLIIPILILILFAQVIFSGMKTNIKDISLTLFGILYIVIFIMFLALIEDMEQGKKLLLYAILAAWGTDVFAFFVGVKFGKHKISKISPKKSIEGAFGGIVGAICIMLIYTYIINTWFGTEYSYLIIVGIGLILSIISQIGDFAASTIKRYVNIKDYSNLIPGHGGMLDRIDSLIFLAPFAYILFMFI